MKKFYYSILLVLVIKSYTKLLIILIILTCFIVFRAVRILNAGFNDKKKYLSLYSLNSFINKKLCFLNLQGCKDINPLKNNAGAISCGCKGYRKTVLGYKYIFLNE